MLPILAPAGFRIIAHRGASAYAPENTMPAFRLAREMGIGEVEADAQLSSDGVVVLCHDRTLERYGHGNREVEASSSRELLNLDMGSWFSPYLYRSTPMLRLGELLAEFAEEFTFHLELKGTAPKLAEAVRREVAERGCADRVVYTSFSLEQLGRMRETNESCRLGWLVDTIDEESMRTAEEFGLFQLCPRAASISGPMVVAAHRVVTEVRAWGLAGDPTAIRSLVERTIDAGADGLTINWPDWVAHAGTYHRCIDSWERRRHPLPMSQPTSRTLPSVFVIGDSISVQYGPFLSRYLEPFFAYHRKRGAEDALEDLDLPVGANGGDSSMVLAYLEANDRHREIPFVDYLLVNCGLHDIKTDPESGTKQIDIDSYQANLERIVECSSSLCGEFVWIRTTPCDESVHNKPGMEFHRYRSDCDAYNTVADRVMSERGAASIDLYSFTETLGPELYADHVHFPEHIQQKQAAFIAGWLVAHHGAKR